MQIPKQKQNEYLKLFKLNDNKTGFINGNQSKLLFSNSLLDNKTLAQIWTLSDKFNRGKLNFDEFSIFMHLIDLKQQGFELPQKLPIEFYYNSEFENVLLTKQANKDDLFINKTNEIPKTFDSLDKAYHLNEPNSLLEKSVISKREDENISNKAALLITKRLQALGVSENLKSVLIFNDPKVYQNNEVLSRDLDSFDSNQIDISGNLESKFGNVSAIENTRNYEGLSDKGIKHMSNLACFNIENSSSQSIQDSMQNNYSLESSQISYRDRDNKSKLENRLFLNKERLNLDQHNNPVKVLNENCKSNSEIRIRQNIKIPENNHTISYIPEVRIKDNFKNIYNEFAGVFENSVNDITKESEILDQKHMRNSDLFLEKKFIERNYIENNSAEKNNQNITPNTNNFLDEKSKIKINSSVNNNRESKEFIQKEIRSISPLADRINILKYLVNKNMIENELPKKHPKPTFLRANPVDNIHIKEDSSWKIKDIRLNNNDGPLAGNEVFNFTVTALYVFDAQNQDELSFIVGDILEIERENEEWYYGHLKNNDAKKGWFPSNFVIVNIFLGEAKVIYEYNAQQNDELSVNPGDVVNILDNSDENWWRVEFSGAIGLVPAIFLKIGNSETHDLELTNLQNSEIEHDRQLEEFTKTYIPVFLINH